MVQVVRAVRRALSACPIENTLAKAVVSLLCGKALAKHTTHRAHIKHENDEQMAHTDAVESVLRLDWILARSLDQHAKAVVLAKHHVY